MKKKKKRRKVSSVDTKSPPVRTCVRDEYARRAHTSGNRYEVYARGHVLRDAKSQGHTAGSWKPADSECASTRCIDSGNEVIP